MTPDECEEWAKDALSRTGYQPTYANSTNGGKSGQQMIGQYLHELLGKLECDRPVVKGIDQNELVKRLKKHKVSDSVIIDVIFGGDDA